jgi:DNA mismatch repair protein MutL
MAEIRRLPPEVITKIAAGEVVERPASVVKELLENAVDAGARRIEVHTLGGGTELVRVVDDGCGIRAEQLELAVANHSTSKIRTAEDLFRIGTLGFRGEALAAIASVSHLLLRSRPAEALEGAELFVIAGRKEWLRPCGCPPGTTVEVKNLFFNTPVRRRFLRGTQTELAHVTEAFTRIALGYPEIHLALFHNGRILYELPPTTSPQERIAGIFGRDLADRLIPVENREGPIRLWGFVAHPQDSRTTSRFQYLFVNRRYFRDRSLQHALAEAYRGLLPVGRYPVAFIWIEMPPELVDVNVHPTKLEVRFQDGARLYGQLLAALRTRFLSPEITAQFPVSSGPVSSAGQQEGPVSDGSSEEAFRHRVVAWAQGKLASWIPTQADSHSAEGALEQQFTGTRSPVGQQTPSPRPTGAHGLPKVPLEPRGPEKAKLASAAAPGVFLEHKVVREDRTAGNSPGQFPPSTAFLPKAIQVLDAYLVTESPEGILLIDQHALHEKILATQLLEQLAGGKVASQGLAIPEPVDLRPEEAAILLENRELLHTLGLEVEPFGGSTLLVQAYPAILRPSHLGELLRELAQTLAEKGKLPDKPQLIERLAASLACKAAVKAGDRLTPEEISALLAQQHLVRDGLYCPHGRPAVMVLSRKELERYFHRS